MKKLELYQMENVEGGKWLDCVFAVASIFGAAATASTFVGMGFAIAGIASAIYSGKRCLDDINSK